MKYVVRRGSHTHQTPHSKHVHKSPEIIVAATKTSVTSMAVFARTSNARSPVMSSRIDQNAANAITANDDTATGT